MIGETIGNFRVISRLGAGGMGEVFLAEQKAIGTKVAIKVLRPEISADTQHVERFFNEARAVSRIKHAGIVKIFDVGHHTTGHAYLVMEFLEGETLASRIQRVGPLPISQISDIGKQTASILEATHSAGITHRDLKPDNIFLVPDGELASQERVKILDFGIAKLSGQTAAGGPRTVGTMGTPAYMAPEQWGDASKVDWRADIYSLGCVAFEMAAGRPPFVSQNFAEACGKHLGEAPPKLRSLASVPEALESLVDAMLAKSPYGRPPLRDVGKRFVDAATAPTTFDETIKPRPATPPPVAATVPPDAATHGAVVHNPTPAEHQTPRNIAVPPVSPTVPLAPKQQTTLSSAAGAREVTPKKSRAPLYAIGGLVVVGGGIAAIVAASSGGGKKKSTAPDPAIAIDAAVAAVDAPEIDAAPVKPAWTPPRYVDIAGLQILEHQVTRGEYLAYLESRDAPARETLAPLKAWSPKPDNLDDPLAWIPFESARTFCKAAGGDLPTQDQWIKASKGSWRIGTTENVIREWTSTVTPDGLAIVLGGTTKMTDAQRTAAIKNPLSKPASGGGGPEALASASIGFRCVKGGGSQTSTPAPKPPTPPPAPQQPAPPPQPKQTLSCSDTAAIEAVEDAGDLALAQASYAVALAKFEQILPCRPIYGKAYLAACKARAFPKAKQYFPMVKNQTLAQVCLKEGFDPR